MATDPIVSYLKQAGFSGDALRTAWAIVQRESSGNPRAFNGNGETGDQSYGLFQINMLGAMGPSRLKQFGITSNDQLLDPLTNARAAYKLSKGGTDFGAWGIGPNAYRSGAGWDTIKQHYDAFPGGGGGGSAPAAPSAPAAGRRIDLKSANQLARAFGFKSFGQAFGLSSNQARALVRSSNAALAPTDQNPNRVIFHAKPTGKPDGAGVAELFYDPAGQHKQWDQGNWIDPIGGHSDHVHVSFSDPQTALRLIHLAQDMGLRVGENPYVDGVDPVHVKTSFHYRTFPGTFPGTFNGKQLGEAIDVSGPSDLMMRFYDAARRYVGS